MTVKNILLERQGPAVYNATNLTVEQQRNKNTKTFSVIAK